MQTLIQVTLSLIIGSVITIGGISANTDEIVDEATRVTNGANFHQIATILELYYLNNGKYPTVESGEELINLFEEEGYIRSRPMDPSVFTYSVEQGGEDYTLAIR